MYSRSPSRNQRSKGIRVKHILQICVLVAVCFWLIYQVKRSHEKKKEFAEKDASLASETQSGGEILRLGRKDISRVTETGTDDKLHGEDDEENEVDEEENRHEEDEQERESRTEDREEEEDTGIGDGDDEIDKRGEEKIDDENPEEEIADEEKESGEEKIDDDIHEQEFVDEEKEREGDEKNEDNDDDGKEDNEDVVKEYTDDGGKEDNEQDETVSEDQDEGGARNTHEAREEHYKADDASSEVAHDTRTIIPDTENATVKHTVMISDGKGNLSHSSNQTLLEENSHESTEGTNSSYSSVTGSNKYNGNLTASEHISSENSTTLKESIDQPQVGNNLSQFDSELSTNTSQTHNATHVDSDNGGFNTPMSLFSHPNTSDLASDKNQSDIEASTNFTRHANTTSGGSLSSSGEVKVALAENTTGAIGTKADDVNSANAGIDESAASNSENHATEGENESALSDTGNDNAGNLNDHIDDFDSSLTQEEKDYRTDLGTLPDINLEAQSADDVEAE